MRRLALALVAGGMIAAWPAAALAATPPLTGSFSYEDQFTVQPGDPASCAFPVAFDLQVRGTYQVFLDAQGQPVRMLVHEHWTGTGTANGKYVIENAAHNNTVDLISGASATVGQIHDRSPSAAPSSTTAGCSASTPTGPSRSRPARIRDSTVTPTAIREFGAALS